MLHPQRQVSFSPWEAEKCNGGEALAGLGPTYAGQSGSLDLAWVHPFCTPKGLQVISSGYSQRGDGDGCFVASRGFGLDTVLERGESCACGSVVNMCRQTGGRQEERRDRKRAASIMAFSHKQRESKQRQSMHQSERCCGNSIRHTLQ